jgi:O-antigen/teichoic acid export membrane protein
VITTTYTNAIYATGHPKTVLALMFLYTALTWGIGLPLLHYFGFVGIAITVCLITYLTFPLVLLALRKVVIVDTWGMVWRPLISSLLMGVVVYILRVQFVHGLWSLIGAILSGAIVYGGILYVIDGKYLKTELGSLIHSLLTRG